MAKETKAAPKAAARPKRTVRRRKAAFTADDVAVRAYHLWEAGSPGDELEHWLQAERDLATA